MQQVEEPSQENSDKKKIDDSNLEKEPNQEDKFNLSSESILDCTLALDAENVQIKLKAATILRKKLSQDHNPPIDEVVNAGAVPKFVHILKNYDNVYLQFEVCLFYGAITMVDCLVVNKYC
jgi:hypothetical protein